MAKRDIASDLVPEAGMMKVTISSDTTTYSSSIEVGNDDAGFMFFVFLGQYVDGDYALSLQDSPDDSVWTAIPAEKLILPDGAISVSAVSSPAQKHKRIGAFSDNAYVRLAVTSTNVTSGTTSFYAFCIKFPEGRPHRVS